MVPLAIFLATYFPAPPPVEPFADVLARFPAFNCTAAYDAIQEHRSWVRGQFGFNWRHEEELAYHESYMCWSSDCWWALKRARDEKEATEKETWLRELRRLLGEESYLLGRMPAPVPYWRYQRID